MADRLGPRLLRPLGVLSGALLAVALGGAALGVAPETPRRTAPPAFTAAGSASDAVHGHPTPGSDAVHSTHKPRLIGPTAPTTPRPGSALTRTPAPPAPPTATPHPATTPTPTPPLAPTPAPATPATPSVPSPDHPATVPTPTPATHPALSRSTPIRVALPSIGLTAPLLGLGLDSTGSPEVPPFSEPGTAGWLRDSATPGAAGTAVLVGHVDTRTGPAVFWNLSAVTPGSQVEVTRLDGSTALFTVDAVRAFDRSAFPAAQIYAQAKDAQLRIITCGGAFDRTRGQYTGNVVLFAHLDGVRAGAA